MSELEDSRLVETVQARLAELGYLTDLVDNAFGPLTERAMIDFKRAHGFRARPYIGPLTLAALFSADAKPVERAGPGESAAPWLDELRKYEGKHERTHNAELKAWLRSDGSTLGDPAKFPWCGDAVVTALRNTLGDRVGNVPANPYLARNWQNYGVPCPPVVGAVAVFWRGSRDGLYGHVAFIVGEDGSTYHVLGGNQSNGVNVTRIQKSRLLATRWPAQWPMHGEVARVAAVGKISTNEA